MTEPHDDPRDAAPDDAIQAAFDDFEVETEALPDGRQIHYYRWPADEPQTADV